MGAANFAELLDLARQAGTRTVGIIAAQEREVLEAARAAEAEGIAECALVGDRTAILTISERAGIDLSHMEIIHIPDPKQAAREVIRLVRQGHVQVAMKGRIETGDFLRAVLDKENGLRAGRLLSHVAVFEIPGFSRLILVTDAGVVVAPDITQKVEIVQNAIEVAVALGITRPKVAILAATEMVNPKIPTTLDAANLAKMADRGQIRGGIVDGPLALDNAISPESSSIKGIQSPVAGQADILVAPDVEAGNMLAKAITYFAGGLMAGVVVGAQSPLIVASRADPHRSKLMSIALGILMAQQAAS